MIRLVVVLSLLLLWLAAPARADVAAGYEALDRGDYGSALRIFEGLAAEGDAAAINALGVMHADGLGVAGDEGKAAQFFRRAAELGDVGGQVNLGYAYDFALGVPHDSEAAEFWYRRGVAGGSLVAKNNLAYTWSLTARNLDDALSLIREVLAVEPEHSAYLDTFGWILYQSRRYREAVEPLCRAAILEPGSPEIAIHLGDALWRAGHDSQARLQWQRALELQANPADLSETGRDYLGVQDPVAWSAALRDRVRHGVDGDRLAPEALPEACASHIS